MKRALLCAALLAGVVLTGCNKDNGGTPPPPEPETAGFFILSEGDWNLPNGSLAWYDVKEKEMPANYFTYNGTTGNPVTLGKLPQDMVMYGTKAYCTLTDENQILVLDAGNGRVLQVLSVDQPRFIACAGGSVYVSMYEGAVSRIDTTTLAVTGKATVTGTYCEGIAALNGKLYVANNGTPSGVQREGNKVSVIDLSSFQEEAEQITVPANPNRLQAGQDGSLYLACWDLYDPITYELVEEGQFVRIDPAAKRVSHTFSDIPVVKFALHEGYAYTIFTDYSDWPAKGVAKRIDLKTGQAGDFIADAPDCNGIDVNPLTGEVFLLEHDATENTGNVHCYSASGSFRYSLSEVGNYPTRVAFVIR